MDFGDILEQWDKQQKESKKKSFSSALKKTKETGSGTSGHKNASATTVVNELSGYDKQMKEDSERVANPMEVWLRRYGVIDKDAVAEEYEYRTKIENREFLRNMRPEETIDLHGLTRDEAWSRLDGFVSSCKNRGLRKILIIHGKGNHSHGTDPILGEMVRTFIENDKRLGSSGHPNRNHGGSGATWVIIRQ